MNDNRMKFPHKKRDDVRKRDNVRKRDDVRKKDEKRKRDDGRKIDFCGKKFKYNRGGNSCTFIDEYFQRYQEIPVMTPVKKNKKQMDSMSSYVCHWVLSHMFLYSIRSELCSSASTNL
jgi:hypothetical protein